MKKTKLFGLLALIFCGLLLAGCGRSDVTLTVNDDGSFTANVVYGIEKDKMGSPEVLEQLKTMVTSSLEENGVEYAESEDDSFVYVSVSRDFANIGELTSEESWRGIGMAPKFTADPDEGGLWTRYEDGRLKIDGTLNAAAFGASELVTQGSEESFGGSLSVILPGADEPQSWSGTAADSVSVSLSSAPLASAESVGEGSAQSADGGENAPEEGSAGESGRADEKGAVTAVWAAFALAAAAVCVLCAWLIRRKRAAKTENREKRSKKDGQ